MRVWMAVPLLLTLASCAHAGRLSNSFTMPTFEATVSGADTCAAGTVLTDSLLTARRRWSGPVSGQDSLAAPRGTPVTMFVGVPNGTYTVTVDVRGRAGNWSCPVSGVFVVRGKPARLQNLGWMDEERVRQFVALEFDEVRQGWRYD
jgi:hypothetical protein